ncbi:MAG: flavodoxin [Methanosphaera stadtmanae]|nr:flavodoxin [Methanosphaera stadtmanae]
MSNLIIYYSRSGKTKLVSKIIQEEIGGTLVEIKDKTNRSGIFGYVKGALDAMLGSNTDIEPDYVDLTEYDTIYVGTPVWASKPAPAIMKLLEKCDFNDKNIITFATMGGSGGDTTVKAMNNIIKKNNGKILKSFSIITGDNSKIENLTKQAIND